MAKIQRALLSVFDKTGLIPFAQALAAAGVEIISTGGTAKALREEGVMVSDLSAYTGFPEMLEGRVKTLHPKIHGGLLYLRGEEAHEAAVRKHQIKPIDLVVVNLYPFARTVARPKVTLEEAMENIDIGGPAMLRSGAKNYQSVTVVMDPADYAEVAGQILADGDTTARIAAAPGGQGLFPDGQLRRADCGLSGKSLRSGRGETARAAGDRAALARRLAPEPAAGAGVALRGESAPAGGALRPFRGLFPALARQGTFV